MKPIAPISTHFLYPSHLFVSAEPCEITTVLGSCIAVCLYDKEKKVGGMNHFMLPFWNGQGLASVKYGNIAIERLISEMIRKNCQVKDLVAKVFGGANQVNFTARIGDRNADIATQVLNAHRIKIVAENVGGQQGRKIIFDTDTGLVRMKYVGAAKPDVK